jgi:MFS family permease
VTRRAPLYAVLAAGAVSTFGNMIAVLAVPWFVLETTGSAMLTGVTAAATVLPTIISGALGGALVDRIGHRRTCVVADLGNAATVAAIPLLHVTVGIALWQLLILVFLGALLDLPSGTARLSLVPDLAARAGMPLERANSLLSALQRGAQLLGPLAAGALIASVGAASALWLDAATFVVAAAAVATLVPHPERPGSIERVTYLEQLRRGASFLRDDRLVRLLLMTFAVTNLVASPVFAVGLPVYANRDLGSAVALGVMTVAVGAGSLVGAIGYASIARRVRRRPTFLFALGLGGFFTAKWHILNR